jgi:hypothetical protein
VQGWCRGVARVLQGCYRGVTRVLQGCFRGVTARLRSAKTGNKCSSDTLSTLMALYDRSRTERCLVGRDVTGGVTGVYRSVTGVLQRCNMGVTGVLQGSYRGCLGVRGA